MSQEIGCAKELYFEASEMVLLAWQKWVGGVNVKKQKWSSMCPLFIIESDHYNDALNLWFSAFFVLLITITKLKTASQIFSESITELKTSNCWFVICNINTITIVELVSGDW